MAKHYGGIARIPVPMMNVFSLADPGAVRQMLQDNAKNYSKKTLQYTNLALVAGQGLVSSDGEFWLRQRRMIQPAFHRGRIAGFASDMTAAALHLLARWKNHQGVLDIDHEMLEMTLEIVGKTLFSADLKDEATRLVQATLTALDFVMYRAKNPFVPMFVPIPHNQKFKQALKTLDNTIYTLIEERRNSASQGQHDLLSMLLEARTDEGQAMTDLQLRDELITIITAGHETVAGALAWFWHLLAQHPEAEQKLHAELTEVLAGRTPTVEDLPYLPYTKAVFDETLRLYPTVWLITRYAMGEDEIGGYKIPKSSLLVTSPFVVHRQPEAWPQPEAFKPERFLGNKVPRYAYLPFGGGPRLCIGNNFALLEGQLIIATLAQHFRLRHVEDKPVEISVMSTIRPRGGLHMRLEAR